MDEKEKPYVCEAKREDLPHADAGVAWVILAEALVDCANALRFVEQECGLVGLEAAGVPGVVQACDEKRAAECIWVMDNGVDAVESELETSVIDRSAGY